MLCWNASALGAKGHFKWDYLASGRPFFPVLLTYVQATNYG